MNISITLDKLKEFAQVSQNDLSVRAKHLDVLTAVIITWLEFHKGPGSIYVTVSGFQQAIGKRPSFCLKQDRDSDWYEFFAESFEKMWEDNASTDIDLSANAPRC